MSVEKMARRIVELEDGFRNAVKLSAEQADEAAAWRVRAQAAEAERDALSKALLFASAEQDKAKAVVEAARNDPIKSRSVKRALRAYDEKS